MSADALYKQYRQFSLEKFMNDNMGITYDKIAKDYPNLDKIALTACHAFRLLSMIGLSNVMPFSATTNAAIMLAGTVIYRIVPERQCQFRFALLSCIGAIAFTFAKNCSCTPLSYAPLALYTVAVLEDVWKSNPVKKCHL